ncbi:MAG: helix-turn-helix domain-containing protein [Spirochaetes bacterium]|nr:helix-turn-helix domain-containing protein [Spirochaetota bacterium]
MLKREMSGLPFKKVTVKIGRVDLEYNSDRITFDRIREAVEDAGFEVMTLLKEQKIEEVKSYVNNHLLEPGALRLSAISRAMAISPFHLSRTFSLAENETLQSFIARTRMKYASRLLRETNRTVLDICLELGLNSTSHFTKQFKRYFGQSPLAYRKSPHSRPNFFNRIGKYLSGSFWIIRDEMVQHFAPIHERHYPKER